MTDLEVTFTRVPVPFRGWTHERIRASLSNGAVVTQLGGHGPGRSYFSYAGREMEFLFTAGRLSECFRPIDTWEVAFEWYQLAPALKARIAASVVELQADIRTALLAWPPGKAEAHVPVTRVRFLPLSAWI